MKTNVMLTPLTLYPRDGEVGWSGVEIYEYEVANNNTWRKVA